MADVERLAVLIEANTKAYENAMKRLQSQTDQALRGVKKSVDDTSVVFRSFQSNIERAFGGSAGKAVTDRSSDIAAYGAQLDALKAKYNPLFAAGQRYKADLNEINTALRVGAITQAEHAAAIDRTKKTFAAYVQQVQSGGVAVRGFGGGLTQLSFQINDIVSGLAMGQRPMQILAQQGGQVFQIWQMNNNVFRELKDSIVGLAARSYAALGPFGLAGAAILAAGAAAYLFSTINDKSETAEDHLKRAKDAIDAIKSAFDRSATAAQKMANDTQQVAVALANVARVKIVQDITKQIDDLKKSLPSTAKDITDAYKKALPGLKGLPQNFPTRTSGPAGAFEGAVNQFNSSQLDPAARMRQFGDAVAEVVNKSKDPAVIKFGGQILDSAKAALDSAKALDQLNFAIEKPGETANKTGTRFSELIQRTKDQIAEFKLEAETAGKSSYEVDNLRKKHELIRAAIADGIPVQQALTRARREGADGDAYATAKAAERLAQLRADLEFERQQIGRSPNEQAVQSRLRSAGLDPASDIGQQTAATIRLNQALSDTRDISSDAMKGFISDIRAGKSAAESFANVLNRIADKLLDMAINDLVGKAFSTGGKSGSYSFGGVNVPVIGSSGSGGGFFSGLGKLFGFANGGEFRVGGSGLVDSQVVAFRASPDETVRVSKPGQGGGGGAFVYNDYRTYNDVTPDMMAKIDARIRASVPAIKQEVMRDLPKQRAMNPNFYAPG